MGTSERVFTHCCLILLNPKDSFSLAREEAAPPESRAMCPCRRSVLIEAAGFSLQPVPLSTLRTSPVTVNSLLR